MFGMHSRGVPLVFEWLYKEFTPRLFSDGCRGINKDVDACASAEGWVNWVSCIVAKEAGNPVYQETIYPLTLFLFIFLLFLNPYNTWQMIAQQWLHLLEQLIFRSF